MMQFWVYMLRCSDGSYYTGHIDNLEGRLWQHQQGIGCEWTRRRRPVQLVWHAVFESREEALGAERRIKGWSRARKEALIRGDWAEIGQLARPPHERPSTSSGRMDVGDGTEATILPERRLHAVSKDGCLEDVVRPERRP